MSSNDDAADLRLGETAANLQNRKLQVIEIIGEIATAKRQAKLRRSGETAFLSCCNCWRNGNGAERAKLRNCPILRMGGAASLACAAARPPEVSKWSEMKKDEARRSGQTVHGGLSVVDSHCWMEGEAFPFSAIVQGSQLETVRR